MSWMAAAIGGAAAVGAGTGYLGYKGAQDASKAQAESAAQALAFQKQVYGQQQQNYNQMQEGLSPYRQAGAGAMDRITGLYGLGGGPAFGQEAINQFKNSPDYAFAFNQGQDALQNSAAARGGLLSGNFARAATQYGQGYATNWLKNYTDRLMGVAGMGQNAVMGGGQIGTGLGTALSGQIGSSFGNMGAANASGIVGGTNAMTGAVGSGVQNYLMLQALNKSSYHPNEGYYGGSPATNPNLNPSTYNYS